MGADFSFLLEKQERKDLIYACFSSLRTQVAVVCGHSEAHPYCSLGLILVGSQNMQECGSGQGELQLAPLLLYFSCLLGFQKAYPKEAPILVYCWPRKVLGMQCLPEKFGRRKPWWLWCLVFNQRQRQEGQDVRSPHSRYLHVPRTFGGPEILIN